MINSIKSEPDKPAAHVFSCQAFSEISLFFGCFEDEPDIKGIVY